MIRNKYRKKALVLTAGLIFIIIFANYAMFNSPFYHKPSFTDHNSMEEEAKNVPNTAQTDLEEYFTGQGVNQTVREYMENVSSTYDNSKYFDIPSPVENGTMTKGQFNFTFQNNFTTEYVLEEDNALHPEGDQINFDFNSDSYLNYTSGMNLTKGGLANLTQGEDIYESYLQLNSTDQGQIDFTVYGNFSDTSFSEGDLELDFNKSQIAGLFAELDFNISAHANLTLQVRDNSGGWNDVLKNIGYNSSQGPHNLNQTVINKNLDYINQSDISALRYTLNRSDQAEFNATLYNYYMSAIKVFELPIRNESHVALEFDLKGLETTVNGFYAWIRTLNVSEAQNTQLNITVCRANKTIDRDENTLEESKISPNYTEKIDSFVLDDYTDDNLSYFEFDQTNTKDLDLYNYFIIIKSNSSERVYNLVTLPSAEYGDDETEHLLKTTNNAGQSWENADNAEGSSFSQALDASQFKLNITRGYMPTDFEVNETKTLQIQNKSLSNNKMSIPDSSDLVWGRGTWESEELPEPIVNNSQGNFQIELTWNSTITNDFLFNVSSYAEIYTEKSAELFYNVTYDTIPEWTLNYSLALTSPRFTYWNLTKFLFIYPDYFSAHNLTTPDGTQIFNDVGGEKSFEGNDLSHISISDDYAKTGTYSVNLTSINAIQATHSYIKYNDNLWETRGFMYGDNISTKLDISDHNGNAPDPNTGEAHVILYYPNGTIVTEKQLNSTEGLKESEEILSYSFSNETILNLTKDIPLESEFEGENEDKPYKLGFFWKNGSMVGCKTQKIHIDRYDINMNNTYYSPRSGRNNLLGTTTNRVSPNINYSLLIASVNDTTGISRPDYYTVENSDINEPYSYEDVPIQLIDFKQNETVLNPEEKVKFDMKIQNRDDYYSNVDVSVDVKLVSYFNEEWIICENSSATKTLNTLGASGDTDNFNLEVEMPTLESDGVWKGVNAPVRKGGVKTVVTLYIDDNEAGTYAPDQHSVLINDTDDVFEGEIISLKTSANNTEKTGKSVTEEFERDECIYLPENSTFIINAHDKNYISSYHQFKEQFSLKYDSSFEKISVSPVKPLNGKTFNASANLVKEFGDPISGEDVFCQQYQDEQWINITDPLSTGDNGTITFTIDTKNLVIESQVQLRFVWQGSDEILAKTHNFSVNIVIQENKISLSLSRENELVYRNTKSVLQYTIRNVGNSTLAINNIEINISNELSYSIVDFDYIKQESLQPNEQITLKMEVDIPNVGFDLLNVTIKIDAKNIISNEVICEESTVSFTVLDYPLYNALIVLSTLLFLLIFALLWAGTLLYRRKIKRKIEGPPKKKEKEEKVKRKREGYKKVSEHEEGGEGEEKSLDEVLEEEEMIREGKKKPKKSKDAK
ncbi:MAG: hypothetical protein ACOC44_01315 [Promethearchaeia archaeon]